MNLLMKVWLWVVNDVAFTFLLRLPESGRIITTMWNRSWGIGAFKTLSGICCQKCRVYGKTGRTSSPFEQWGGDISPYTAEMGRELAIWYGNEYMRLSNPLTFDNTAQNETMRLIPEELELFNWIKSYCIEKGIPCMKKMTFYSVVRTVSGKRIKSTGYWIYCMNKTELYRLLREKRCVSHLTLTS